jgi:hypothetical protein
LKCNIDKNITTKMSSSASFILIPYIQDVINTFNETMEENIPLIVNSRKGKRKELQRLCTLITNELTNVQETTASGYINKINSLIENAGVRKYPIFLDFLRELKTQLKTTYRENSSGEEQKTIVDTSTVTPEQALALFGLPPTADEFLQQQLDKLNEEVGKYQITSFNSDGSSTTQPMEPFEFVSQRLLDTIQSLDQRVKRAKTSRLTGAVDQLTTAPIPDEMYNIAELMLVDDSTSDDPTSLAELEGGRIIREPIGGKRKR